MRRTARLRLLQGDESEVIVGVNAVQRNSWCSRAGEKNISALTLRAPITSWLSQLRLTQTESSPMSSREVCEVTGKHAV